VGKELKRDESGPPGGGQTKQSEREAEEGAAQDQLRKKKISQNITSHGSFFLRVGAIGKQMKFYKLFFHSII